MKNKERTENPSRRLAELLEPEPQPGFYAFYSKQKFWQYQQFEYTKTKFAPITFDDNALRRVREELKRRGLHGQFVDTVHLLLGWDHSWFTLINAPLSVQIKAAVEVLEEAAKARWRND